MSIGHKMFIKVLAADGTEVLVNTSLVYKVISITGVKNSVTRLLLNFSVPYTEQSSYDKNIFITRYSERFVDTVESLDQILDKIEGL